eukprot:CAMPEP_0172541088 /NCGR_PEP_ID=MMETSP1067-20121228/11963_1 /TAXON_ID=265564 ORGANISM="Thalassiosira punctigera, Strain Tpunct2005C2" /NCGR_SAMPLE_ID=MMETSP1067 /ASSEMBLY_ACC=CAM_ASM_000444 /LENGTH=169 /DNA_ID=CAMNT_0013327059 /DNA_START=63 /DNA_END=569 /DNA_ORIENTATION=-
MIRVVQPCFSRTFANVADRIRLISSCPIPLRALSIASASSETHRSLESMKLHPISGIYLSWHSFHGSATHPKSAHDVHVASESGSSSTHGTKTEQFTQNNSSSSNVFNDSSASSGACSQGIPNALEEEEDEQEEMFVVADPVLGHGNIQEWGGPRRGGTLSEPTRFGDW